VSLSADELYEVLAGRRSVRTFREDAPGEDLIRRVIEAAVTAPSASNKQPWRFLVLQDPERISALAEAVRSAVASLSQRVEPSSAQAIAGYGSYFWRFEAAPVLIVPLFRRLTLLSHFLEAGQGPADGNEAALVERLELRSGLIGTSLAIQNLLLMAHALGLGASGMTGPLVAEPALREQLSVPASWDIACLIPLGWPAEDPTPTPRKPIEKVIRWLK